MAKKILIVTLLLFSFTGDAQVKKLSDFSRRMYFNLFTDSAHPIVYDFAKSYNSILVESPDTSGKWTAYFDDNIQSDTFNYSKHSQIIPRHPYFEADYLYCTLELTIKKSKHYSPSVYDVNLFFTFDSKQKAVLAFNQIASILNGNGVKRETSKKADVIFAKYYIPDDILSYDQIQVAVVNDHFTKNMYHLYFSRSIELFDTDRLVYPFRFNIPD